VSGPLAAVIGSYAEFKRATGVGFKAGEYHLRCFDSYCAERGFEAITRRAVEGFIKEREGSNTSADRTWVSYLRGLARWVNTQGGSAHVLADGWNRAASRPAPYLLSADEIDAFFEAAAAFDYPPPWRWQAKAFFGLMLACGLRTCETRRLARAQVDLGAGTIDILWSKGPRSRRLFIDDDVAGMLDACDRRNEVFAPGRPHMFTTATRAAVGSVAPGHLFRKLWLRAGLPLPETGRSPSPYAFRHHFAQANIERWAAQGEDPMALMPHLSRFMGHASIESTMYYLHVSPDYIAAYRDLRQNAAGLLPEAGFDA
jgi:integrase